MGRFNKRVSNSQHAWVTVVNPINKRSLLRACDNCGVVKSENSVARRCNSRQGSRLISSALQSSLRMLA